MLREVEENLGLTQEAVPFPLLSGIAPPGGIAVVREVARLRHQIGATDDLGAIRKRAGDALDMLGLQGRCQHHHDAIVSTHFSTHERYAKACSVRARTSVPAAASSAEVNSSGL